MRTAPIAALRGLALIPICLCLNAASAFADPYSDRGTVSVIDEVRFGLMATDLEGGQNDGNDYTINGEVLFHALDGGHYESPALDIFFHPRPHIGVNYSPGGVSQVYAGLTWDYDLTDKLFLETSFGAAVHDGPTGETSDSYGCTWNFRELAGIGFKLSDHLSLIAAVGHMSNAGFCDQNQGLTNAGVRLGYRW